MLAHVAKAITALIVVSVALFVGDETAKGMDVGLLEGGVVAILTALGVWAVPNRGGVRRWQ